MHFWSYQAVYPWSRTDGTLTDQSRLWLNALYNTVSTAGQGPVQLGGDIGGTSTTPLVIGLQGNPISPVAPTDGQVLTWVATDGKWEPKATAASSAVVVRENPSGAMDGTNKAFTLSFAPNPVASLTLYLNGVEQVSAFDFTIAGAAINYAVAPKATDLMVAQYTH
jgi:hypothetical protein